MTRKEALDWLYRFRSELYVYMPKLWLFPMNDALDIAINSLRIDERYDLEYERCCNDCILYETDACTRAGRAVNDEPCEDFIGAESEGEE